MLKIIIPLLLIALVYTLPANNNAYDQAKAEDVELNSIHADGAKKKIPTIDGSVIAEITTPRISFDIETKLSDGPPLTISAIPTGGSFARLIDDIFQIPIGVLQSVAKLLTGPFRQENKSPEESSKY